MSRDPILRVENLVKRFGAFRALDGISFDLRPGEVLGLVGPNGSGKTTCINVVSGLYAADEGRVTFEGRDLAAVPPHRRAHAGINRTFQSPHPFGSLTVRENVAVAAAYGGAGRGIAGRGEARRGEAGRSEAGRAPSLDALLASLDLDTAAHRIAHDLNSAQQKALDLARALATAPRLLLVDELAAGLNPAELGRMADRLRALAAGGMALLVVEHLMGFIDRVTDRVVVMNAGREIFGGSMAAATRDRTVIQVYLGGAHA